MILKSKSWFVICSRIVFFSAYGDILPLKEQIEKAYEMCSGISDSMSDLKTMAGINTAVTAVGTVAGGVALGTGIAKTQVDKDAEKLEKELQDEINKLKQLAVTQTRIDIIPDITPEDLKMADDDKTASNQTSSDKTSGNSAIDAKKAELEKLTKKSKLLGDIRTGTMATSAATGVTGAIIAATNRVKGGLKQRVDNCIKSVDDLSRSFAQARIDGEDPEILAYAEGIIHECNGWKNVSLSKINDRSTGAAVSSGVGAAMAVTGTVTSAVANTDATRNAATTVDGMKKEHNLNAASNVMAGASTAATATATIFNATQISAIKKAAAVADACEEALK